MITDVDLADMRVDFADGRFELAVPAVRQLAQLELSTRELAKALCDRSSYVAGSLPGDWGEGESAVVACPSPRPLRVAIRYIRGGGSTARHILIEMVAAS